MARVLLVDDDAATLETFRCLLTRAAYDVDTAETGDQGIHLARTRKPDVAIIDFRLPDLDGDAVLARIHNASPGTVSVLATGFWSLEVEFRSKAAGACACVSKPIIGEEVVEMVHLALSRRDRTMRSAVPEEQRASPTAPPESHAAERLIKKITLFVDARSDEPTLQGFGRAVGISRGGFRNWCRTARLLPRSVRDFARGLRAVWCHAHDSSGDSPDLLDIIDDRTLRKFCRNSGGSGKRLPSTVEEYLRQQTFIQDQRLVDGVRSALTALEMAVQANRQRTNTLTRGSE